MSPEFNTSAAGMHSGGYTIEPSEPVVWPGVVGGLPLAREGGHINQPDPALASVGDHVAFQMPSLYEQNITITLMPISHNIGYTTK